MIQGVKIDILKRIPDGRGKIMHIMKSSDEAFQQFGEVYISSVYPSIVKGWHWHEKMTLNYVCITGMIKFVLYDGREDSPTYGEIMEVFMGKDNYVRVTVPPKVWNGFMGIGLEEAMVVNFTDIPHDPMEIQRMDPHTDKIPYLWATKDK